MVESKDTDIKRTPLADRHREMGGRMVEFAGFEMPVHYGSVMDEHRAVRESAGLFDVSHMGEIEIRGEGATAFVDWLTPNDVRSLEPGRAHYSGLLTEKGTYIDDLLVYRLGEDRLLLVVNAANRQKDLDWILERAEERSEVRVADRSDELALLALQGPAAEEILAPLTDLDLSSLRYYRFREGSVQDREALVSRTGYTGEDGFEIYVDGDGALEVWNALLSRGAAHDLVPAGLGARDTLRLEAGMALYGHELDEETTPWEAGLGWVVELDGDPFVGRDALIRQKEEGIERRLIGFEVRGRGIARQDHRLFRGEEQVGQVTSGTFSPTFEKALGMAYVPVELAEEGTDLEVEIRSRRAPVRLERLPFYRRSES